jgi:hypothetical protein
MVLALDARPATKDVDAVFKPPAEVRKAAKDVADDLKLPEDWINDGVKGFLSAKGERGSKLLTYSNLNIWVPDPEYILAMKCMASRIDTSDTDDITALVQHLGITAASAVFDIVSKYFPSKEVPVKTQYVIEEIFEKLP